MNVAPATFIFFLKFTGYDDHAKQKVLTFAGMKVIVDDKIPFIREAIEQIADQVVYRKGSEISAADVADADALIVRTRTRCDRKLLEGSRVQYIATATIGFDHLDTEYLKEKGIAWNNCPGCNASSVGQYVRSCLILLAHAGKIRLNHCTMGIVGAGHVGKAVSQAVSSLGVRILYNDPPLEESGTDNLHFAPLSRLQQECDIISFHTPLVRDEKYPTYHLADRAFLEGLKKQCILFNTSRGPVVDNQALLEALEEKKVQDAVIDTWENEPDINRQLLQRVFIGTPHIAGYSADGKANATRMALENLCRFFGLPFHYRIDPPELPEDRRPDPHASAEDQMLQLYNPQTDSALLKTHPERFEELRGNYPLRREK